MEVEFSLYEGFLIVDYQEDNVKAYRNRAFYAGNTTSYETSSPANIKLMIDEAGDEGDFTEHEYHKLMRQLGREAASVSDLPIPEQEVYRWGPEPTLDKGVEKAAAYIAGLCVGREDVDDPSHPVWLHLEEQYKESYRRRARRVIELSKP